MKVSQSSTTWVGKSEASGLATVLLPDPGTPSTAVIT
jgi:hypothetical protein